MGIYGFHATTSGKSLSPPSTVVSISSPRQKSFSGLAFCFLQLRLPRRSFPARGFLPERPRKQVPGPFCANCCLKSLLFSLVQYHICSGWARTAGRASFMQRCERRQRGRPLVMDLSDGQLRPSVLQRKRWVVCTKVLCMMQEDAPYVWFSFHSPSHLLCFPPPTITLHLSTVVAVDALVSPSFLAPSLPALSWVTDFEFRHPLTPHIHNFLLYLSIPKLPVLLPRHSTNLTPQARPNSPYSLDVFRAHIEHADDVSSSSLPHFSARPCPPSFSSRRFRNMPSSSPRRYGSRLRTRVIGRGRRDWLGA